MRLLLYLLVLENDKLLNGEHFFPEALNGYELVIRLCLLYFEEDLQNVMILVLHLN